MKYIAVFPVMAISLAASAATWGHFIQRIAEEGRTYSETTVADYDVFPCGADQRTGTEQAAPKPKPGPDLHPGPEPVPLHDDNVIWSLQRHIADLPVGALEPAIARRIFGRARHHATLAIEADPFGGDGKVLSIRFKKGIAGIGDKQTPSGFQSSIPFNEVDDLYMLMVWGVDDQWISPKGVHLPNIMTANATKPRPFVIARSNEPTASRVRKAPASPARAPPMMRLM